MWKRRLILMGLAVTLTGNSIPVIGGYPGQVYAKESEDFLQTQETAVTLEEFLELIDPKEQIGITVTEEQAEEMLAVINEVTKGKEKEYDKAKAIYDWVAGNVSYYYGHDPGLSAEPYQVFVTKEAVCGGFSNLIKEMMNLAGIPAVALIGYYGENVYAGYAHQWSGVYVNGMWVYADGTNKGFFDVESIKSTHHPVEVKDAYITCGDLKLGYYSGLAVVDADSTVVQIPEEYEGYPITSISYSLFSVGSKVEELYMSKNIVSMDENSATLKNSQTIKHIEVAEGNPVYASHEGALFSADYKQLIVYPYGRKEKEFTIPKETYSFDYKEAFKSPYLENLYVEEGSTYLASYDGALYNAGKTELISVPTGKTKIEIYEDAAVSDTAFANVDTSKITISAKEGSPGEQFAKDNNISLEEVKKPETGDLEERTEPVTLEEFLKLIDPQEQIEITVTDKQAEEMLALINEVTKGKEKEYDKAKAIYDWVAGNVSYYYGHDPGLSSEPYQVFVTKEAVCGGFSNLIKEMMNLAGIPAVALIGYYGDNMYTGAHQWSGVYVDDTWVYADGTAQGYFNVESIKNTHHPLEVKDASVTYGDLKLGFYHGLAVTGAEGKIVRIPDQYEGYPITSISYSLFGIDSQIEELYMNKNIVKMDENSATLKNSRAIKHIEVAGGNPVYASHEGALFSADYKQLLVYPYAREEKEFTVPKETYSFDYKETFHNSYLENLYVEEGSTHLSSYDGALYNVDKTELLVVPGGKTRIEVYGNAAILDTAFANVDTRRITIVAEEGSLAQQYARDNNIAFEASSVNKKEPVAEEFVMEVSDGENPMEVKVKVAESVSGMGEITEIRYNGSVEIPKVAGIYEITITVAEGTNYKAVENLKIGTIELGEEVPGEVPEEVREGIRVEGLEDLVYNGTKQTQEIQVFDGKTKLTEGKDYTVKYKNNQSAYEFSEKDSGFKAAKAPQIVLKMKGDYSGSKTLYFKIKKADLNTVQAGNLFVTYKGIKQTPAPKVTWNGKRLTAKDYVVKEYEAAKQDKTAFKGSGTQLTRYELTLEGKGNFTGTRKITLTIGKNKSEIDMNKMKVNGVPKVVSWNPGTDPAKSGYVIDNFQVMNGKTQLVEGVDYEVSYENNTKAGTATLVITGKQTVNAEGNSYHGEKRVTFTIGTNMSEVTVNNLLKNGYMYQVEPVKPLETDKNLTVTLKNGDKVPENAYTVTYEKNVDKGTAAMVLSGNPEAGYFGTKKVTFKITSAVLDDTYQVTLDESYRMEDGKYAVPYTAGGTTPEVSVTDAKGNALVAGVDYTVSYKNNKEVATAGAGKSPTVIIKGKGNYTKTTEATFSIVKKEVSKENELKVVAKDKTESSKANAWKQSFKVYDVNGNALKGKDYDAKNAKYYLVMPEGTEDVDLLENPLAVAKAGNTIRIEVSLTGKNYSGKISGTYRILESDHDISKATFALENKEYTGVPVEIGEDDFKKSVLKIGRNEITLNYGEHFEVVKDSYVKNVNKGTAKVTLRGMGSYGGEKTVSFKIGQRNILNHWWKEITEQLSLSLK